MATSVPLHPRTQPPSIPDPPPVNIVQPVHPCTLPSPKPYARPSTHLFPNIPLRARRPSIPTPLPLPFPLTTHHHPCSFPSSTIHHPSSSPYRVIVLYPTTTLPNIHSTITGEPRTKYVLNLKGSISSPHLRARNIPHDSQPIQPSSQMLRVPSHPAPPIPNQAARQRQDRAKA